MKKTLIITLTLICLGCTSENKVENTVVKPTENKVENTVVKPTENKVENTVVKPTKNEALEKCKDIELIADIIMENRQYGVPMSKAMLILDKANDEQTKQIIEAIIVNAYEIPKFSTEASKKEAITDFKEVYFLGCYKDMTE